MALPARVLVVDDEDGMRKSLAAWLADEGYQVVTASSGPEALEKSRSAEFDVALVDLKMPGMDGLQVLERLKATCPQTEVVLITAYASVESAVNAMKMGAYDYVIKPFQPEEINILVSRIVEHQRLVQENLGLREEVVSHHGFAGIIGKSRGMQKVYSLVESVAPTDATVLIQGDTGTGKELIARAIHSLGPRKSGPFVATNCGALPQTLLESELFGHEKGSFTGAIATTKGRFETAHGGTLFLDEVCEMDPKTQVTLLRAIQEREFHRVGGAEPVRVDVRILSATNKDIEAEVKAGRFRQDLYYRLNVVSITVPPLRERGEDVMLLAQHFLLKFNRQHGKQLKDFTEDAAALLLEYNWPGNVRELENAVEQAVVLSKGSLVGVDALPPKLALRPFLPTETLRGDVKFKEEIERCEREIVRRALERTRFVKKDAAKLLGLSPRSLSYYLKKYGLGDSEPNGAEGARES